MWQLVSTELCVGFGGTLMCYGDTFISYGAIGICCANICISCGRIYMLWRYVYVSWDMLIYYELVAQANVVSGIATVTIMSTASKSTFYREYRRNAWELRRPVRKGDGLTTLIAPKVEKILSLYLPDSQGPAQACSGKSLPLLYRE
jgi:hypothetical protein